MQYRLFCSTYVCNAMKRGIPMRSDDIQQTSQWKNNRTSLRVVQICILVSSWAERKLSLWLDGWLGFLALFTMIILILLSIPNCIVKQSRVELRRTVWGKQSRENASYGSKMSRNWITYWATRFLLVRVHNVDVCTCILYQNSSAWAFYITL